MSVCVWTSDLDLLDFLQGKIQYSGLDLPGDTYIDDNFLNKIFKMPFESSTEVELH